MKTLMAFSGGLDSTYLAWRILTDTDDELHCFWMDLDHIKYKDKDGNHKPFYGDLLKAEKIVAPRVIDWLSEHIRPVTLQIIKNVKYVTEPEGYPKGNSRGWRVLPMLKTAASLMPGFDRFVYAKSPENLRSADHALRDAWNQDWWTENAPGTLFQTPLLEMWHGRPHEIKYLPADLYQLALTCNKPVLHGQTITNCEECEKCRLTKEASAAMFAGVTPEIMLDYLLRKRNAGPYINLTIAADPTMGAGAHADTFPEYT